MAREVAREELARLVIEEVDDARDVYRLAEQLAPLLPIKSFDDLLRAGKEGRMRFRDAEFDVESLRAHLPTVVFPVEDLPGLVERLGHLIRMVPPHLGVDISSPEGLRRQLRASGAVAPGFGLLRSGGLTAIAGDRNAEPQQIPGARSAG